MYFTVDRNNIPDKPYVYLATPNKDYLGTIQAREMSGDLCFNNISQISFVVNKYENGIETEYYDDIENLMLVELSYLAWFQITSCNEVGTGLNLKKEITALSLENEATTKVLTSFGQLGVDTDEQGGLDMYCLYNINDVDHSILHIFIEKMPAWTIGYVDPEITKEYRSFTDDSIGAYTFLTTTVAEAFGCIFFFNTFDQTVNAYTIANAGKDTQIFLSYQNLVKQINKKTEASDIYTVMTVAGGDDNGTTMGIIEVNPAGSNQIANFEHFKPWMTEALRNRLTEYETAYDSMKEAFAVQLDRWNTLIDERGKLYTKFPEDESSTDWTLYGLNELQAKKDYYHERMSLYTTGNQNASYTQNQQLWSAVNAEIAVRQAQIEAKEAEIEAQAQLVQGMKLNLREFLGEDLFKELSRYWHETTFTDSTFIVKESMSDADAFQMRRDLLDAALKKLATVSKPQFTIDIDAVNFTQIPEFIEYTEELELGNIITLDMGDGLTTEARILKIHMDWDKPENFSITISSKNSLDGFEYEFAEIMSLPNAAGVANAISGTGWNNAKAKVPIFDDYKNGNLDLQKQKLLSGSGEEVVVDTTGLLLKRFDYSQNKYSNNQLWATSNGICLSKNAWESVAMAIGEGTYNGATLYGVWADLICGDLLISKELRILNAKSSIVLNEDGATFKDCNITITKGVSVLTLNAADGIKITKSGVSQFYLDGNGNVVFSGNLNAATGTFSGTMTAGSININNRFVVDSSGNMTANNVTINSGTFSGTLYGADGSFSGSITASSGSISGFNIYQNELEAGTGDKYIRISPVRSLDGTGGYNYSYASVDLGKYGNDTRVHLRSDGYCRFGLNSENGAVRFNYTVGGVRYPFYSTGFRTDTDGTVYLGGNVINNGGLTISSTGYMAFMSTQQFELEATNISIWSRGSGSNQYFRYNGQQVLTAGANLSDLNVTTTTSNNIVLKGSYNAASVDYVQGNFARDTHTHNISNLGVSYTSSYNISLSGAHNGASVTYCQATFARLDSSDLRLKYNILSLEELPDDLFMSLKAKQYGFKSNIYNDKINFGFIAQQVESAFESHGLDPFKYNLIELVETRDYTDEGLYVKDKVHRINYNNFISWNINMTQKLYKKVDEQQTKIDTLEERVTQLEKLSLN